MAANWTVYAGSLFQTAIVARSKRPGLQSTLRQTFQQVAVRKHKAGSVVLRAGAKSIHCDSIQNENSGFSAGEDLRVGCITFRGSTSKKTFKRRCPFPTSQALHTT